MITTLVLCLWNLILEVWGKNTIFDEYLYFWYTPRFILFVSFNYLRYAGFSIILPVTITPRILS